MVASGRSVIVAGRLETQLCSGLLDDLLLLVFSMVSRLMNGKGVGAPSRNVRPSREVIESATHLSGPPGDETAIMSM